MTARLRYLSLATSEHVAQTDTPISGRAIRPRDDVSVARATLRRRREPLAVRAIGDRNVVQEHLRAVTSTPASRCSDGVRRMRNGCAGVETSTVLLRYPTPVTVTLAMLSAEVSVNTPR